MNDTLLLALPFAIPVLAGAIVLPFLRKNAQALAWVGLLTVVATVIATFLGPIKLETPEATTSWLGLFNISLALWDKQMFFLGFIFLFQILNSIYLLRHITRIPRPYLFMVFSLVAFGGACGVILAQNLLVMLIGWQMFLIALYALVLSGGDGTEPVAMKTLILGGASDFLMILGMLIYEHVASGELDISAHSHIATGSSFAAFTAFVLMFLGAGAKAGMWPFQTWIPEAAEAMPTPGFASLPASLSKILGVYFLFRICNDLFALSTAAKMVMFVFAIITIFAAIIPALVERNFKRVLAFITISSTGFMVAGLATSTVVGMIGALMFLLTHATYMAAMFYSAGNLEQAANGSTLEAIEGRKDILPYTVLGFLLALTAAVALLPTGGFLARQSLFDGLFESHNYFVFFFVWVGAIFNVAVVLKLAAVILAGWKSKNKADLGWTYVLPVIVLGIAALMGGFILDMNRDVLHRLLGANSDVIRDAWSLNKVSFVASFGVWVFGAALFFALRNPKGPEWSTFHFLRESKVLGRGYELAEEKTFDAYEVGLKVIHWIANQVFWHFERLMDRVADWCIRAGRNISRPALSSVHTGVYSNYLAWVITGLALVSALVLLR
jgi:formate hydrogenlyase subunit 3/multisubunit Na+/H+ antiporter MnhD subunit